MGDDLIAARTFVDLCDTQISALIEGGVDGDDAIDALTQIEEQATALKARAICRVTRLVRDDFEFERSDAQRGGNLLALNKLILQYKSGLEEVEQAAPAQESRAQPIDGREAFELAATTLNSVMKLAKPGKERRVLEDLMSVQPWKLSNKKISAFPLEGEMTRITDDILRTARQQGKTVSVSLSAGNIDLSPVELDQVVDAMIDLGNQIVSDCIEGPETRLQKGYSRSAHISYTGQREGDVFHILVTTTGKNLSKTIFAAPSVQKLVRLGMKTGVSCDKNTISIALADIPLKRETVRQTAAEPVLQESFA